MRLAHESMFPKRGRGIHRGEGRRYLASIQTRNEGRFSISSTKGELIPEKIRKFRERAALAIEARRGCLDAALTAIRCSER